MTELGRSQVHVQKSCKIVCTSAVAVSLDPLSPASTSSTMKTTENAE